ncbi:DeoR/GlpR family transcriptional regulator of sugar metabolism [Ochrobactrum daejeonense]|uniref:DeoR/GlpR family transcriptional regulator of sugar metabolism n=2 Tax=Brucella daejeonensis TaxID=659015 RepID=A0A7W9AVK6_9HYPH|nr:DeoR/GlpR family transcriptional regulator of sugar metabolism [Brucella daejeonensis]
MSLSTIRRDVEYLCEMGILQRTHGGATLEPNALKTLEPPSEIASSIAHDEKKAIGEHAAHLVYPGQTIIIDSGTTTTAMAVALKKRNIAFRAVTNDLHIGSILSENPSVGITVTGGSVRNGTATILGVTALQLLSRLRADVAFIGTHAANEEMLSDTTIELAEIKRTIMGAADRVVLLADSSKFFSSSFCEFGRLADIDMIITDSKLPEVHRAKIRSLGIALEVVEADNLPR